MKSETQIRRQLRVARLRFAAAPKGSQERVAAWAVVETLAWVANSTHPVNPTSTILDAHIADFTEETI